MNMYQLLIPFADETPPENVDLFGVSHDNDPEERVYGIMRYYRKGDVVCIADPVSGSSWEERLLDAVFNDHQYEQTIPETGYYFLSDEEGDCRWIHSCIKPLDSSYVVINPEDEA